MITLVLAAIQFDVSESSSHFLIHFLNKLHLTGSCQFSPHTKQNKCKHRQITGLESIYCALITLLQSGDGHHRNSRLHYLIIIYKNVFIDYFIEGIIEYNSPQQNYL